MIIDRMMRIMAKSIDRKRDRKPLRQKGCSLAAARRSMSVENLKMAARPGTKGQNDWTYERVLETFPRLKERLGHGGQQLSGGEQQMLTIGRALMTNPDVLILDEATEGLAPLIAREIWRICSVIKDSGISSIIVDKNWKHVTKVTDRNVILVKGEVVFEGSSESLQAQPEIMSLHLGV
jgi:branched-chain amino acid transport system ATP-binding protein